MTTDEMIAADLARLAAAGPVDANLEGVVRKLCGEQAEAMARWSQDERVVIYVTAHALEHALAQVEAERASLGVPASRRVVLSDLLGMASEVWRQMQEEDE